MHTSNHEFQWKCAVLDACRTCPQDLVRVGVPVEVLLNMHLKHDAFLHSGIAKGKGIGYIDAPSFAKFDLVSYIVALG